MPCYEVNIMTILNFNLKSKKVLLEVLKDRFPFADIVETNGIIFCGDFTFDLNKETVQVKKNAVSLVSDLKVRYSKKIIEMVAKKKNWRLKKISENKMKATKF